MKETRAGQEGGRRPGLGSLLRGPGFIVRPQEERIHVTKAGWRLVCVSPLMTGFP